MTQRSAAGCLHCGDPCQNKNDAGNEFCCNGCKAAYHLIGSLGLSRYYSSRDSIKAGATKPDDKVKEVDVSHFIIHEKGTQDDEGINTLHLMVQGIHCASCVWLIESTLAKQEDVLEGRINMTTRRMTLRWKGDKKRGNALVQLVMRMGYRLVPYDAETLETYETHEQKFLLWCLCVAGFASGNIMLLSIVLWSGTGEVLGFATRDFMRWISVLLSLPTVIYSGQPFFRSALSSLKARRTNMDVPISLAVILATGMSLWETIHEGEHVYFEAGPMLLFFLLIGRYLDMRARGKARGAAQDMLALMAGSATVIEDGMQRSIPISEVKEGMMVMVATGEKVTVDGIVIEGESELDTSLITGETLPRMVKPGEPVFTGTINLSAPLTVKVAMAGDNSLLAEVVRLMEHAEQGQAKYVRLADRVARLYTPVVHGMALLTFLFWWLGMHAAVSQALMLAVTVLIITCPCALGLAVPVVQVLATSRLMRQGIILKSGDALEKLAKVDHACFDKTGTLTLGHPELTGGNYTEEDLRLAASLAAQSRHPLSRAVSRAYRGALEPMKVKEVPGCGLESGGIRLGKRSWATSLPKDTKGGMELFLSYPGHTPVQFVFADKEREDAAEVIRMLQKKNIGVTLLSGDRKQVVQALAEKIGITEWHAEMSPVEKTKMLQSMAEQGSNILMAGDGLNDAPALSAALVSMSPSSAMDITQNAADIVFQGEKLGPVLEAYDVARQSSKLVKQNFGLALAYNVVAIPVAVAGYITPLVAAIAMSSSSILVILNALRLNRRNKK